jgi:hypothetical protein
MLVRLRHLFGWLAGVFRSRADLILKNLALRQRPGMSRGGGRRPEFSLCDDTCSHIGRTLLPRNHPQDDGTQYIKHWRREQELLPHKEFPVLP